MALPTEEQMAFNQQAEIRNRLFHRSVILAELLGETNAQFVEASGKLDQAVQEKYQQQMARIDELEKALATKTGAIQESPDTTGELLAEALGTVDEGDNVVPFK